MRGGARVKSRRFPRAGHAARGSPAPPRLADVLACGPPRAAPRARRVVAALLDLLPPEGHRGVEMRARVSDDAVDLLGDLAVCDGEARLDPAKLGLHARLFDLR